MYVLEKLRFAGSRITNEKYVNIPTKACTRCQFQSIPTKELHYEKSTLRKRQEMVELEMQKYLAKKALLYIIKLPNIRSQ